MGLISRVSSRTYRNQKYFKIFYLVLIPFLILLMIRRASRKRRNKPDGDQNNEDSEEPIKIKLESSTDEIITLDDEEEEDEIPPLRAIEVKEPDPPKQRQEKMEGWV